MTMWPFRRTPKPIYTIEREGKCGPASSVWLAWQSGSLKKMLAVVNDKCHPVDRHFLLMTIVMKAYKQRRKKGMADLCIKYGWLHIQEFPRLRGPLIRNMGKLPRVSTHQYLSTVLTERGRYEDAIRVCELAIEQGLSDGTKGGYRGRIDRIRRKMQAQRTRNK